MEEYVLSAFAMWAAITGVVMLVTGFSYRVYLKNGSDTTSDLVNVPVDDSKDDSDLKIKSDVTKDSTSDYSACPI